MERPVAWVYVVALNASRREWRRHRETTSAMPVDGKAPDQAARVAIMVTVKAALDDLAPRQRAAA